jgi:xanthine dehydrogenase accessory factor
MRRALLERLNAARAANHAYALITDLSTGAQALIGAAAEPIGDAFPTPIIAEAERALARDESGPLTVAGGTVFVQVHNPPRRMVIVGAVHITQALAQIAELAGYRIIIVDPRRAFADAARFPSFTVSTAWPDDALNALKPDRRTALVTLTHDPKIDDPALETALKSEIFYIGSLGSTRTHAKRLARLREKGFDDAALGRIHGPVGLDIGALSPAEIAISIMAEIIAARGKAAAAPAHEAAS